MFQGNALRSDNNVYNPNTLSWEPMQQPYIDATGSNLYLALDTVESKLATLISQTDELEGNTVRKVLTIASGSASSSGNNTLITPTVGTRLVVYYASYNPASAVEAAFRFGAAGTLFLRNSVVAGSVIAKDFGDFRCIRGAINEALILNLSGAVTTLWNCFYVEE
jgi:hypothetical protein